MFSPFRYCIFRTKFRNLGDIPDKILKGCRKKDSRAQEELYRLVAPKMYGVCLQYAGNNDDAKDILQEGFIKVFDKIQQFQGKGSFEGWIRKIIINTAIEKIRFQTLTQNTFEKIKMDSEVYYDDVIDNLSADELISLIRELSPKYRAVFSMYAIEGYDHKEISDLLGITEGTSKSNLSRARKILQEKVKDLFGIIKNTR